MNNKSTGTRYELSPEMIERIKLYAFTYEWSTRKIQRKLTEEGFDTPSHVIIWRILKRLVESETIR